MDATVTIRFWAGARHAAGHAEEAMAAASLKDVRAALAARPELARICAVASYLVDGARADDDVPLPPGAVIDVLPPFAGG